MGFFSKVWKGVKKGFKKIGKGIKSAFKSFGKFMGKIGILGSIALTLLTGGLGIGAAFSGFGASLGAAGASMGGAMGGILKAASWTIGKAAQFGTAVKSGFQTLTKGVTEFFGQAGKYIGNKLGMSIKGAPTTMGEAWGNYSSAMSDQFGKFTGDVGKLASKAAYDPVSVNAALGNTVNPNVSPNEFADGTLTKANTITPGKLYSSAGTIDPSTGLTSYQTNTQYLNANQNLLTGEVANPLQSLTPEALQAGQEAAGTFYDPANKLSTFDIGAGKSEVLGRVDVSGFNFDGIEATEAARTEAAKALAAPTVKRSLLGKTISAGKNSVVDGITAAPGAVVSSLIVNKAMGVGEVEPYFANTRVADFDSSYGIAGAVELGLTQGPDPLWSQQLFDYDAYGNNQGGYSNVYANRMGGRVS